MVSEMVFLLTFNKLVFKELLERFKNFLVVMNKAAMIVFSFLL